jgi:hypothetical protein
MSNVNNMMGSLVHTTSNDGSIIRFGTVIECKTAIDGWLWIRVEWHFDDKYESLMRSENMVSQIWYRHDSVQKVNPDRLMDITTAHNLSTISTKA